MIDTIILELPLEKSVIFFDGFTPSLATLKTSPSGFVRCYNNPTKADWLSGIYKPRLTAIKRGSVHWLKIEFSAPKILFNNNVDEVSEKDFDELVKVLRERLKSMGLLVYTEVLNNAFVRSFHPSKNIPLFGGYTSSFVIKELIKADISKTLDLNKAEFRNNGQVYQIYSNSHSFVIYDKVNDLTRPAKRATDKDQTFMQKSIFEEIRKMNNPAEILRLEVRITGKKVKSVLAEVGYQQSITFKNIFKKNLCKKIVNLYWDRFFADNLFLFDINKDNQQLLSMILAKNPKVKIKQAIFLLGLILACRDDEGMRGFRGVVESYKPKTNWTVLKRELRKFQGSLPVGNYEFIRYIERELSEFRPFKLSK